MARNPVSPPAADGLLAPVATPSARRLATPRWLDTRLVLGVLLVLVSVLVGARVLAGADRSQLVWATNRALAPGSVLNQADLVPVQVRLFDSAGLYLDASRPAPVGYVASRGLGRGELVPAEALRLPGADVDFRLVTVLVDVGHVPPDLTDAQQVDVWLTPTREPGAAVGQPTAEALAAGGAAVVLSGVTVSAAPAAAGFGAGASSVPVVLQVRPQDVGPLLSAVSRGRIDLVRVPRQVEAAGPT